MEAVPPPHHHHLVTAPRLRLRRVQEALNAALDRHVIVIGDVMLDEFTSGVVERICPEAPVQVLNVKEDRYFLGGAGNVAHNLAPYLGRTTLVGVTGHDDAREKMLELLRDNLCDLDGLVADPDRATTRKTRFVAQGMQLLRADRESAERPTRAVVAQMLERFAAALPTASAVVAADYNKGVLSPETFQHVVAMCAERRIPLLVDPKRRDLSVYRGATLIKPNQKESELAAGFPIESDAEVRRAAELFREQTGAEAILITLGPRGMMLCERDRPTTAIPTDAREVFDVTGAGDTTIAFLALGRAAGLTWPECARLANAAAGITVGKRGTARAEPMELLSAFARMEPVPGGLPKMVNRAELQTLGDSLRRREKRIVFTNGCFDLIHAGHIELLRHARALGDVLVVGINSDDSVRRLKGPSRPFLHLEDRAGILNSFEFIDHLVVFDENTPRDLISDLRPQVLVKGGNYTADAVEGADLMSAWGGRVELLPVHATRSITRLSEDIHRKLSLSGRVAEASQP